MFASIATVPVITGIVALFGEDTSLLCPGQRVDYSCHSSLVTSITWHILCPEQQTPATSFFAGNDHNDTTDNHACAVGDAETGYFYLELNYASIDGVSQSNLSITVEAENYTSLRTLSINCEDSTDKYLLLTGE